MNIEFAVTYNVYTFTVVDLQCLQLFCFVDVADEEGCGGAQTEPGGSCTEQEQ